MKATEVIQTALAHSKRHLDTMLSDLSDADLLVRPAPGANHLAWQLGHLIKSEVKMVKDQFSDAAFPELPAGFVERHGKETAAVDPPTGFASRAAYLDLFNRVRQATIDAVGKLSDADLDKPSKGTMAKFFPTLGGILLLVSNHTLMHSGQFAVVRRKQGKPVLM